MSDSAMYRLRTRLARWIDPDTLPAPSSSGTVSPGSAGTGTALVIAGGGARSSFEIGALKYLYRHQQLDPVVISGTSAGSILAAVLAQHSDAADQLRALEQMEEIWAQMRQSSDMFAEQEWFTALREHIPTWRKVVELRQRRANRASLAAGLADLLAKPREAVARITGDRENGEQPSHAHGTHGPGRGQVAEAAAVEVAAAARITPAAGTEEAAPATEINTGTDTPPEHERHWSPAHALETLSTLWEAGRSSTDLEFILRGAQQQRSAFRPGTIVDRLLDPEVFSAERLGRSALDLRVAVVGLESGELRYIDQHGRLRDRSDAVLADLQPVGMFEAVLASCSIPGVFPPVPLAGEHYIDGGVRENVPAAIVLDRGDVDQCFVVVAAPEGVATMSDFAQKDLMEILMRSTAQIGPDEIQRDEVRYARERGAVVIQPELDIHDMVTIDPGLVSIAIDYGYLRAADVCEAAEPARQERTRNVIQLRRLIWTSEDEAFGPDATGEPTIEDIAELKIQLRDLIADPGSAHLPPSADQWWRTWERHPFAIEATPTWSGALR
ncbi:patatin-like phospholipase family protein [Pseudactinotalea sp. Z1732]|uniref:patatin-like phospholipase family protein n=1 Tax=Pseudactinotalea sp. Z1732 TaxID=3413026 RepID=UPI003C7B05BE